jgi:hypothetical protein
MGRRAADEGDKRVMKSCFRLACASLLSTFALGVGCAPAAETKSDDGGTTTTPGADGGAGSEGGANDGGSAADGATGPAATSCSTGTLFAGNPIYDGEPNDRPAPGTGIHADPPLQWQNLVFSGNQLYTRDTGEVWGTDVSAANPVENRIAGLNTAGTFAYNDGPCASARFGKIEGMAAMADGSLLVADVAGNGVLKITDPTGAACKVEYYAGNTTPNPDLNLNAPVPNGGDVDGPGASAKFDSPAAMALDDAGNAYVFDQGNRKIRKIANDAAHTVTTLAKLAADGPERLTNLTRVGGSIYGIGTSGTEAFVLGVDIGTGVVSTVIQGKGDKFPPVEPTQFPALAGLTTDGQGLIISGKGYVWNLTTKGALTLLAGSGLHIDFPENGYDPKAPQPALKLQLPPSSNGSLIGSSDYITYHQGGLYFRGRHQGTASFVERIACP